MARRLPNIKAREEFKERLFFGLILVPVRLFCDHCGKYISGDMEWRCGYCDHGNTFTTLYSFLNKCEKCKRAPKSYSCPHCKKVNFLDKDEDAEHPARSTAEAVTVEPQEDPQAKKRREHQERKEELKREIDLAQLNAKLAEVKMSAEFQKKKSAQEKLEESFSEHDAHVMGAHMLAKEQRAKNAERYKDDPELLEMANESLAMWLENQL